MKNGEGNARGKGGRYFQSVKGRRNEEKNPISIIINFIIIIMRTQYLFLWLMNVTSMEIAHKSDLIKKLHLLFFVFFSLCHFPFLLCSGISGRYFYQPSREGVAFTPLWPKNKDEEEKVLRLEEITFI